MENSQKIVFVLCALVLVFIVYLIIMEIRMQRLAKRISFFCRGRSGSSMEEFLRDFCERVEKLEKNNKDLQKQIYVLEKLVNRSYQKTSILRYDAYEEMGGKLSFVLCMLDKKDDGFLYNVVSSRDGSYSYIKEVIDGESFTKLTEEEEEVLIRTIEKE